MHPLGTRIGDCGITRPLCQEHGGGRLLPIYSTTRTLIFQCPEGPEAPSIGLSPFSALLFLLW